MDNNSESDKKPEEATQKESKTQENTEEKKLLEKAGVKLKPNTELSVTEEENKKEEPMTEQHQEEILVSTEQTPEEEISKEEQEKLAEQEQDEESYFQEHIAKDPQERRSDAENKKQYRVREEHYESNFNDNALEKEAKVLGITKSEVIRRLVSHGLHCIHCGREFRRFLGYENYVTAVAIPCDKCKKIIPQDTELYQARSSGRILCPECWVQKLGDPATRALILKKTELKNEIRVLSTEKETKAEQGVEARVQERIRKLVHELESLWPLVKPSLDAQSLFYRQLQSNQNTIPPKFDEYVNKKVGMKEQGGAPSTLIRITEEGKTPQETLMKICELAWKEDRSPKLIGNEYNVSDKTISRWLKELESMKAEIIEFINGKIPETRKPIIDKFIKGMEKFNEDLPKAEELIALLEATAKTRMDQERQRRRKQLREEQTEQA